VPSAVQDLRDLQDAVGELVKIHAGLQILANARTGTLQAEVEAVVIEGISVFGLVAKYQARVHESILDSLLRELAEASTLGRRFKRWVADGSLPH
jgi:hypothetical protein